LEEVKPPHHISYFLGAFAKVCLALDKKKKERVVWKIFEKIDLMDSSRRKNILNEIGILKNYQHPNICKLISCI